MLERSQVEEGDHEQLDGQHNEHVVDVEAGMRVVEGEESVQRELGTEVIVLPGQHLLAHTRPDLGRKVEDGAKAEVAALAALVVLAVLDAAAAEYGVHTGVDILVEVEALLRLRHASPRGHEDAVKEVGMSVVELAADLGQRACEQGTERLLLASGDISEDANVLREDVLPCTEDGYGALNLVLDARRVRRRVVDLHLLELCQDAPDLEALLEVVVLVGVDELDVLAAVEDDGVVLVVWLAVAEDRVAGELDAELGPPQAALEQLGVAVDEGRVEARLLALSEGRLLVQVRDLEVRVRAQQELGVLHLLLLKLGVPLHRDTELELAPRHALQLALELVRVAAEHLHHLRILDAVEELDGAAVVHEAGDGAVEGLEPERRPDARAQGVFGGRRLEADAVEGQVVDLALGRVLVVLLRVAVELRGLVGEDLGVLNEAVPLVRVQLLEVLQQRHARVRFVFADDLPQGEKDLLAVVRDEDGEGGHVVNGERLGDRRRQWLGEEGQATVRLAVGGEKLGLEGVILLRHEEGGRPQRALALLLRGDLVVEQLLHVVDSQQVLAVHWDDDGVPDLGDKNLRLVLDLHVSGREDLGVNALRQPRVDVAPGCHDRGAEIEGPRDREDGVDEDVEEVRVEEEEDEVSEHHEAEQDVWLVLAEDIAEDVVAEASNLHDGQVPDRVAERERQVHVRLAKLEAEHDDPEPEGHGHVVARESRVACRERLARDVAAGVLGQVAAEEAPERHDGEEQEGCEGDEELDDTDRLCDGLVVYHVREAEDKHGGREVQQEDADEEEQALGQVLRAGPAAGNVRPLGAGREDLDQRSDDATDGDDGPLLRGFGLVVLALLVLAPEKKGRRVVRRVEPEHGEVDDPDAVEVDQHVEPRARLFVSLEEALVPWDVLELKVALRGRHVDELRLVLHDDALDALGVPEKLVAVVVANRLVVVALAADVHAVRDLVALVPDVLVEGGDDVVEVRELLHGLNGILARRRVQVVVGALEDEAEALGHEPHLVRLAPAEEVEGELTHAVVLWHAVHPRLPAELGSLEAVVALKVLQGLGLGLLLCVVLPLLLLLGPAEAGLGLRAREAADGVVQVKVGGEVPLAVVGVVAADVVGVEGQQGLVRRHPGGPRVKQHHEVVIHVAHAIPLEAELGGQVNEDVLNLLLRERDLGVRGPRGVGFTGPLAPGQDVAVV